MLQEILLALLQLRCPIELLTIQFCVTRCSCKISVFGSFDNGSGAVDPVYCPVDGMQTLFYSVDCLDCIPKQQGVKTVGFLLSLGYHL